MTTYVDSLYLDTHECGGCGVVFAMTQDFIAKRKEDKKGWYCPNGCSRVFTGETKAQKLKRELDNAKRIADQNWEKAINAENERDQVAKTYMKMRDRVKNGVCPCCNRTFQNLAQHIKTKHPEFSQQDVLKAIRENYGLTQSALGDELGLPPSYISLYERERPLPGYAKSVINGWLEENA